MIQNTQQIEPQKTINCNTRLGIDYYLTGDFQHIEKIILELSQISPTKLETFFSEIIETTQSTSKIKKYAGGLKEIPNCCKSCQTIPQCYSKVNSLDYYIMKSQIN